jgi:hypothetical protein
MHYTLYEIEWAARRATIQKNVDQKHSYLREDCEQLMREIFFSPESCIVLLSLKSEDYLDSSIVYCI